MVYLVTRKFKFTTLAFFRTSLPTYYLSYYISSISPLFTTVVSKSPNQKKEEKKEDLKAIQSVGGQKKKKRKVAARPQLW